ncbi:MAG: NADH-quinone oxidoreductase subunit A [Planctomycetaceae bacterium]
MTDVVVHFLIFAGITIAFLIAPLLLGKLVRPNLPTPEKLAVYECGEPTIGTSYVQFDLRFYVVALLFIVFDVEVAMIFPWVAVYGGAMQLADPRISEAAREGLSAKLLNVAPGELAAENVIAADAAQLFGVYGLIAMLAFFGLLILGFAYEWQRGEINWVRAVADRIKARPAAPPKPIEDYRTAGPAARV